jgi:hypothetical protein
LERTYKKFGGAAARVSAATILSRRIFCCQQGKLAITAGARAGFSENVCQLDQSGILAQNFSLCGKLRESFFSASFIQNPANASCQVFR